MRGVIGAELLYGLLSLFKFLLIALVLLLQGAGKLLVLCLQLLDAILHALNMQLQLLLNANVLADVRLQILDQLLVHVRARRHVVRCVNAAPALARLCFGPVALRLDKFDFFNRWASWREKTSAFSAFLR